MGNENNCCCFETNNYVYPQPPRRDTAGSLKTKKPILLNLASDDDQFAFPDNMSEKNKSINLLQVPKLGE